LPIQSEQRTLELGAVTGVDLELPVKVEMIAVLCNRHPPARWRPRRRVASPALASAHDDLVSLNDANAGY
jgi:hypothetical protein